MAEDACLNAPYTEADSVLQNDLRDTVLDLRVALEGFPQLLAVLDDQRPQICLSSALFVEKAYVDVAAGRITLSSDMPRDLRLVVLVHELRHVDQLARGICPSEGLAMKEYARGVLALEADASVVAVLVAWTRKEDGDGSLWQAAEGWVMTADIAARFAAAMIASEDVGQAASAAFEQWYAKDARRDRYYVASCSAYLDRQDLTHALPSYLQLSADYLDRLCILPDGQNYACEDPAIDN